MLLGVTMTPLVVYSIQSWNGQFHGAMHLHGHSHGTCDNSGILRFDMGIDYWDFKPVTIEAVLALETQRKSE
jgi:calcineurin-like phosphoesterase family protein